MSNEASPGTQEYETELLRARREAAQARADVAAREQELMDARARITAQTVELEQQQERLQEQAARLQAGTHELEQVKRQLLARSREAEDLREAAEAASAAKSNFLAMMSHELRTPLNAITGYVQLLQLGVRGPLSAEQLELLKRVERSSNHLLQLINQVLDLARIESGTLTYSLDDFPLDDVIADVLSMVAPRMAERKIEFRADVGPGWTVHGDASKVRQILLHMLGNAAKFTPVGGRVSLSQAPAGARVAVHVSDTGPGIPQDMQDGIFDPFVQVDSSRTRAAEGTGLGLAISRDHARGMGGDLTVRSVPGAGSTFTLLLPRAEPA